MSSHPIDRHGYEALVYTSHYVRLAGHHGRGYNCALDVEVTGNRLRFRIKDQKRGTTDWRETLEEAVKTYNRIQPMEG
jgi:hypothetical protein